MNKYYIYKYEVDNKVVYVGQSINLKQRINQHNREEKFQSLPNPIIYYFECRTKLEMDSYEYFLINKYHPTLNVAYNNIDQPSVNVTEPSWVEYKDNNDFESAKQTKPPLKRKVNVSNLSALCKSKEIEIDSISDDVKCFISQGLLTKKIFVYMCIKRKLNEHENLGSVKEYVKFASLTQSGSVYSDCKRGMQSELFEYSSNTIQLSDLGNRMYNKYFEHLSVDQLKVMFESFNSKYSYTWYVLLSGVKNEALLTREELMDVINIDIRELNRNIKENLPPIRVFIKSAEIKRVYMNGGRRITHFKLINKE